MDFSMKRNSLDYYKRLGRMCARNEFTAETVVPDTQEDIARILGSSANVCVHTKNALTGRVCLTGDVTVKTAYVPESENGVCSLDFKIPFSVDFEVDCTGEVLPVTGIKLVCLDVRMLNPRKVLARAELAAESECYTRDSLCWYDAVGESGQVYVRKSTNTVKVPSFVTEKSFNISDELSMPTGKIPPERLLLTDVTLGVDDWSDVGGRLIIRGTALSRIMYLAADSVTPECVQFSTQYSQLVELPEGSMCGFEVTPMLTDAFFDVFTTAGGAKALSLEIHAVAQCVGFSQTDIELIDDAYSTEGELEVQRSGIAVSCGEQAMIHAACREELELQRPAAQVIYAGGISGSPAVNDDRLQTAVSLNVIYRSDDGSIYAESGKILVEAPLEAMLPECASAQAGNIETVPNGNSVSVNVPVDFAICRENVSELSPVTSISLDDEKRYEKPRPSVTVVRADCDDMWRLAKRYRSCEETIMKCNGLEAGEPVCGKILLIPKV